MKTLDHRERPSPGPLPQGSVRERLARALRSERMIELYGWYLLLVMATCGAKIAFLDSLYRHKADSLLQEMTGVSVAKPLLGVSLFARDVLQTALIAACLFLSTAALTRRAAVVVHRLAALLLFLALAANHLSFEQLGVFLSWDVLMTAQAWLAHHPELLRNALSPSLPAVALSAACWIAFPAVLARWTTQRRLAPVQRALPVVTAALIASGALGSVLANRWFSGRAFPAHGYWAGVAGALFGRSVEDPRALALPSQSELLYQYRELAFFPRQPVAPRVPKLALESRIRPRHVLVVGLETAPRAFYPLTTSSQLPTFQRMTKQAIVSEHHYTTSPYTRIANFSILSGLYAQPSGLPGRFGSIIADGFAAVLRKRGYQTSYVDSWVLDWKPGTGERAQAEMLGFDTVTDSAVRRDDGVFEVLRKAEEVAFDTALERILLAQEHGQKAAVFVGTMLGHAPWPAARGDEHLTGSERVHEIALTFDRLFARLLMRLAESGLSEDILILVVGDHGLRFADEFESLGRTYAHSDLAFNVPFLLYAPGLVDTTLQAPYPTSHVDITPTLLHLVGESTQGMLHHGLFVLDERLRDRVVYLSNSKLGPVDGFAWAGHRVTYHALTGAAQIGDGSGATEPMTPVLARTLAPPLRDPASLLDAFARHTSLVTGLLLRRGAHPSRSPSR